LYGKRSPKAAWKQYEGYDPEKKLIELRGWASWTLDRCNVTRGVGCPCLITNIAQNNPLPCDAGYKCVKMQGVQPWDIFDLGRLQYSVQATCERCSPYELCTKGTMGASVKTCPPGYDCSNNLYRQVDRGMWSDGFDGGLCGITTLLNQSVYVSEQVFDKVRGGRTPLTGTYCPQGSVNPFGLCPQGFYCPNESVALPCGRGMMCKEGSVQPRWCDRLGVCNGESQVWHIGASLWALFVLGLCIGGLVLRYKQSAFWNVCLTMTKKAKTNTATGYEGVLSVAQVEKYRFLIKNYKNDDGLLRAPVLPKNFNHEGVVTAESITRSRQLVELTLLGLEVKVGDRPILYPNSATFKCCGVNAIMGASGCGKSTLLTALMGKVRQGQDGKLIMKTLLGIEDCEKGGQSDVDVHRVDLGSGEVNNNVQQLRSFVPQDDIVCGDLTVRENIAFSMLLNVHHTGNMHLDSTVDWVMEQLQIKHIQNSIVGTVERRGISGGQRKRVSIGMGIACLPSLLLLDEPTSGLDATTSEALINVLGGLTRAGITVVCVLHQPRYECWMLLDQVLLLSKYGTLFFGSPTLAIMYFTRALNLSVNINENPADAIMDIISTHEKDFVRSWIDTGFSWCKDVNDRHPHLHAALNLDVFFESSTKRSAEYLVLYNGLELKSENDIVTPKDIRDFIKHKIGMRSGLSMQQLTSWFDYISDRWGDGNVVLYRDLAIALQDITLTVKLQGKHENIIDKAGIINSVQHGSGTSLKVITLVRRFISTLRKKVHAHNPQNQWLASQPSKSSKTHMHDKGFINEVVYFVLLLKAMGRIHPLLGLSDSINKIKNDSIVPVLSEAQIHERRIPAVEHPALRMVWYIWVLLRRKLLSIWRSAWSVQLIMPLIAAIIVGMIHGSSWGARDLPGNLTMAASCLGVLSAVTHIRTFALDRLVMRRDEMTFAYLIAYGLSDLLWINLVLPLSFGIPYWLLIAPYSTFDKWWITWIGVSWWTSGVVYIIGVLPLALHWLNIVAAFIAVIFGAFINGLNRNVPQWLNNLSYAKWATETLMITEFQTGYVDIRLQDDPHYSISIVAGVLGKLGFCKAVVSKTASVYDLFITLLETSNPWKACKTHLWVLFVIGTVGRCLAAVLLLSIENWEHIKLWISSVHKLLHKKKAVSRRRRRSSVETNELWMSPYHTGAPRSHTHT
jgi:ABC-type multidrug transport system ATPase subunit